MRDTGWKHELKRVITNELIPRNTILVEKTLKFYINLKNQL